MFNLEKYIKESAAFIESELDKFLPPESERPKLLNEAIRYAVFAGGKRIRPAVCFASALSVGGTKEHAIAPAMAIEILHNYTLVHDDLPCMDNDIERRGKPTVHVKFGEANAVLIGDAMQAIAFEALVSDNNIQPSQIVAMIKELAVVAGTKGVVGGQVEDIAYENRLPDKETCLFIHQHKTADLFIAAAKMGAISANANEEQLSKLANYAKNIGMAFQITDDMLDFVQDEAQNASAVDGNMTSLTLYSMREAYDIASEHIASALSSISSLNQNGKLPLEAIAKLIIDRVKELK